MEMLEAERATRQSWPNTKPLPPQRSRLSLQRTFTEQEYARIRLGFIPERMEDKWFMFTEEDTLYVHRSWTGYCVYQLTLNKVGSQDQGTNYVVGETFVNRDENQYSGSDDLYDEKMLAFLIDHLLLQESYPMPLPPSLRAGLETELHYHHVLGAGQRAETAPINLTIRGMLGWLWRWLIWLIKR